MKKLLVVIDMQNDFITGALGTPEARRILPSVAAKIHEYRQNGDKVIFTRDTHSNNYLETLEGKYLPVAHCIKGTEGHLIESGLDARDGEVFDKPNFGSLDLAKEIAAGGFDEVELCGLCTDICVVSNALILKAQTPETEITVDARCCAGVTEESHKAALLTMKMCHVNVTNDD
ncbi:MAG: cysteine hydrolase [Oscillospiraceae bacterium]|nr:cysteine hydrolase [Oscillospiraceae bacterium]